MAARAKAKKKKVAVAPALEVIETTPVVAPAPDEAAVAKLRATADDEGGTDWCACGCGRAVDRERGERYRFYASPFCAYRGMMRRRGERSTLLEQREQEQVERQVERAQRPKPTPPPRREKTPEELEHSELRYGPKRTVVEVLETYGDNGQRAKIKMECGHVRAWYAGETVARCMKCRPTPISGGSGGLQRRPRPTEPEVAF